MISSRAKTVVGNACTALMVGFISSETEKVYLKASNKISHYHSGFFNHPRINPVKLSPPKESPGSSSLQA